VRYSGKRDVAVRALLALLGLVAASALALVLCGVFLCAWQPARPGNECGRPADPASVAVARAASIIAPHTAAVRRVTHASDVGGRESAPPHSFSNVLFQASVGPTGEPIVASSDGAGKSAAGATGEHPLFAALRASAGQPIPAEVRALALQITAGSTNDLQRARSIYDWITDHIRYDTEEWAHVVGGAEDYCHDHDPLSVLRRGTTVCIGYAWLFDALAQSVGLRATYLIGDVRGYRGTEDDTLISAFKHAWNAVEVDRTWMLLDATWGARQTEQIEDAYAPRRAYYFNTPANQLIFDHLPESAAWQFLLNPVPDVASFAALPNLKPAFFTDGLRLANAFTDTLHVREGAQAGITLLAPEGVRLIATLSQADGANTRMLPVRQQGNQRDIVVESVPTGTHLLRVYSSSGTDPIRFECAADFVIVVD
jgi:transglutaminase-like putative cysteine protease